MTAGALPKRLVSVRAGYQSFLAVLGVTLFFTNLAVYLFGSGLWPVPPLAAVVLFALLALPLLLDPAVGNEVFGGPFLYWVAGYLALAGAGFIYSSGSEIALEAWRTVVLACLVLVSALVVFADAGARRVGAGAIAAATVLAVVLNFYEILHPQAFGLFAGRPAGLYRNPNISGAAIVFGLILGQRALPARYRGLYLMLTGAGVLVTLSRAAILAWAIVAAVLLGLREVRISRLLWSGAAVAVVVVAVVVPAETWAALFEGIRVLSSDQVARLTLSGATSGSAEVSTATRLEVARAGWAVFGAHPVFGAGLGATLEWALPESTHNIYLRFMAELGIVGLVYYLVGIGALLWGAPRRLRGLILPFGTYWVVFGLFTHNLLEERAGLLSAALVAATVAAARRRRTPVDGVEW